MVRLQVPSTGKASPNDAEIVIVIIIIVGEESLVFHGGGIIAQTRNRQDKSSGGERPFGVLRRLEVRREAFPVPMPQP